MFFILNLVLWIQQSSAAIPFTTLLALLALWFGISVPLTFVGAYFGFKKRVSTINGIIVVVLLFHLPPSSPLLALWFGISVPLTFVGAYFGFKKRGSSINGIVVVVVCQVIKTGIYIVARTSNVSRARHCGIPAIYRRCPFKTHYARA